MLTDGTGSSSLSSPQVPVALSRADTNAASGTILIVDDEELNLDMLSRRLRRSGYTVDVASSGTAALDAVARANYDIVLLDQMMPGMSGSEVLRVWRGTYSPQELPVVMVTAVAESDKIAAALEAGANDYITKPVDYPVALARIRAQLSRARAEQELRRSEERYALAARASRDGLWDWNLESGEVYYSPRWMEMLGLSAVESTPETWLSRVLPTDRPEVERAIQICQGAGESIFQCSYRMLTASGALRWMSCRAVLTRDTAGRAMRLAGSQSDVTEEKTRDSLTGLPNRVFLLGHLERLTRSAADQSFALLLLDLDRFKVINDSLGHMAGDELLRQIASRLRAATADPRNAEFQAICSRLGGDAESRDAVQRFVERLQATAKGPFFVADRALYCAFSVGIALPEPQSVRRVAPERVLEDADAALYQAKGRGRGEVAFYEPGLAQVATERFELENELRGAVGRGELAVFYQAKADLSTGAIFGVEALLRWHHPARGLLAPAVFIPVAEESGQIVEIGHWVLEEACRQVRSWHTATPLLRGLQLSVNLSPAEFKQPGLVEKISEILARTEFDPQLLHLEITESLLIEELESARELLHSLKALGLCLELDDFGTGYSSLTYLRELPFDTLKIDRHFTLGLTPDQPATGRLVQAIIRMAESLGLSVVAEGVETEPHSTALQQLGCRLGQGYLFSRPVNAGSMAELLAQRSSATTGARAEGAPL